MKSQILEFRVHADRDILDVGERVRQRIVDFLDIVRGGEEAAQFAEFEE